MVTPNVKLYTAIHLRVPVHITADNSVLMLVPRTKSPQFSPWPRDCHEPSLTLGWHLLWRDLDDDLALGSLRHDPLVALRYS